MAENLNMEEEDKLATGMYNGKSESRNLKETMNPDISRQPDVVSAYRTLITSQYQSNIKEIRNLTFGCP